MTPVEKYQQLLAEPQFFEDPEQRRVVDLLEALFQILKAREKRDRRFFGLLGRRQEGPIKGLYLWGGVGRGKTMLMDLFYECLPEHDRLRMHFHRFMQRVHRELTELSGTSDPLKTVAEGIAEETSVICFDEFFVSDIGDAMILGELFEHLFARGVTLVATSNVEPDRLYENGLQRRRFLPAIESIKAHTRVHRLETETDYRLRVLERAEIYHVPLGAAAERSLSKSFHALAPEVPEENVDLVIENRTIRARMVAEDVAWFEFAELCEGPRSQNDYIELSRIFHAVVISNVRRFSTRDENAARRFISLVDEFYDHNVKLILSADAPIESLYAGERLRFEFERTRSRLLEMQSHEYLARTHLA
ncbi:MAG: cell division protein ZapE [Pseudomonadales bacterium]|jgi:cell division protein ZapE